MRERKRAHTITRKGGFSRKNGTELICERCSKPFYVPGGRVAEARFCSQACYHARAPMPDDITARLQEAEARYPGARAIPLAKGRGIAILDAEDFAALHAHPWCLHNLGYAYFTRRGQPVQMMHRLIMQTPPGLHTDHINGDKLDNRRSNLRICTPAQNLCNLVNGNRRNTSGAHGVYFHSKAKKWAASIRLNGKNKHLGLFTTVAEASAVRREAELKIFGEFAPRNR